MKTWIVACACIFAGGTAQARDDEARIEQLMHRTTPVSAPAKQVGSRHAAGRADPAAALIGHPVRVETVEHGLYLGTLQAVDAGSVTLDIPLPRQALRYSLPRSSVAGIQALDAGAP
jgi:hypothetical protein